jgi:hypothetical protein
MILDTNGNIFGGFTPVEWKSLTWNGKKGNESNCIKADASLKSFLFTLKNPHNLPGRRFALKAEQTNRAISCRSAYGPSFYDIGVKNNCNANSDSYTSLGWSYTNDTGVCADTFFTGSRHFQAKDVEVFEITF